MTTQALTVVESNHSLAVQYPGMALSANASQEEMEDLIITASQYTGASTIGVDALLTRKHPLTKEDILVPIELWGVLAYQKDLINQATGEVYNGIGIVFKILLDGEEQYLSFTSVAATNFFRRSILPLRPVGDWDRPLFMIVREKLLDKGRTYNFQLVKGETR